MQSQKTHEVKKRTELIESPQIADFFANLFDFSQISPIDVKKNAIASNFSSLIYHCGLKRNELAEKLGWEASRLSKVLSGNENLTIKTMVELSVALDYDFDMIFHKAFEHRALQPWESNLLEELRPNINLTIHINTDDMFSKTHTNLIEKVFTKNLVKHVVVSKKLDNSYISNKSESILITEVV